MKKMFVLLVVLCIAVMAGYFGYSSLTPAQQQKLSSYMNERSKSYNEGPGSRTIERAQAKAAEVISSGSEKTFHFKNGTSLTGLVNFETPEFYSVTLQSGSRTRVLKSDLL